MPLPPTRQVFSPSIFLGSTSLRKLLMLALVTVLPAPAQYPGHTQSNQQKKPGTDLRAISVLEWVGEPGKPVASRLVPVSVYVDGEYQDGGLYLAQPAPLTVQTDTLYELEKAGVPQGTFYIAGGEDVAGSWFGYGKWNPPAAPKPVKKLPPSKVPPRVVQDNDPDRPQFKGKDTSSSPNGSQSGASGTTSSTSTPPASPDPDKPTLHRRDTSDSGSGTSTGSNSPPAPDDPDRPHLKKHSDASSGSGPVADGSPVSSVNEADPDRPRMSRSDSPVTQKQLEATKLTGMPADLQQMAAVSDAITREQHPYTYQWNDPADATKMQAAIEALATRAVLNPDGKPIAQPASPTPAAKTSGPRNTLARRAAPRPLPVTFSDEIFRAYELSYNGGATLAFTAKATVGPNNAGETTEKYVTIIAQPDFDGVPQVRLQSVTDAKHLDITPRMRLVDAVDTRGDNQAQLLFELRRSSDRQFAIYRMRGSHAEQAFATESLPIGAPNHIEANSN
jgi:hypothetical protein